MLCTTRQLHAKMSEFTLMKETLDACKTLLSVFVFNKLFILQPDDFKTHPRMLKVEVRKTQKLIPTWYLAIPSTCTYLQAS